MSFVETTTGSCHRWWKAEFRKKETSRKLPRSSKWFDFDLNIFCSYRICSSSSFLLMFSLCWLTFIRAVYFCFQKPKSKEQFRWWISMRFPNQGMDSLPGIKAAAFRGGITGDLQFLCTIYDILLAICYVCFRWRDIPGKRLAEPNLCYIILLPI